MAILERVRFLFSGVPAQDNIRWWPVGILTILVPLLFLFCPLLGTRPVAAEEGRSKSLRADGLSLSGQVSDANGKAITDATVALDYNSEFSRYNDIRRVKTDGQGRFGFDHCQSSPASILVTKEGLAPQEQKLTPRRGNNPLTFRLEPAATIRGRVVDVQGHPQVGVAVSVSSWHDVHCLHFQTTTDDQGRFVWTDAPPDTVLFEFCTKERIMEFEYPLTASHNEQEMIVYPKLVIRGSVVDEDTGEPIKEFEVFKGTRFEGLTDVEYDKYVEKTIRDGFYELPFPIPVPGNYVKIVAKGYAPAVSREFAPHDGLQTYDFHLRKSPAVSGVVLLPDGKPAENAWVALDPNDVPFSFRDGEISFHPDPSHQTDSQGRFSFPARISYYNVVAANLLGLGRQSREEIEKSGVIQLHPWGRIEGTVWNGQEAAKHEKLTYYPHWYAQRGQTPEGGYLSFNQQATTDDEGHFSIETVCPGKGTIVHSGVVTQGGRERSFTKHFVPVEVVADGATRIDIGRQGRTVIGRIGTGDRQVDWAANVSGFLKMRDRRKSTVICSFLVQPGGLFQIDNVPPGDYALDVAIKPSAPTIFSTEVAPSLIASCEINGSAQCSFTVPEGSRDEPLDLGILDADFYKFFQPGERAPALQLETLAGEKFDLRNQQGKMVLLYFWYPPFPHREIYGLAQWFDGVYSQGGGPSPMEMQDLYERFRDHPKFAMLGLAVAENKELLSNVVKTFPRSWPQAYVGADSRTGPATEFGIQEFPTVFIIDPQGNLVAKCLNKERVEAALEDNLCFLDKKRDSSNTVEWNFEGPFSGDQKLIEPFHNSWVRMYHIAFSQWSSKRPSDALFDIYCSFTDEGLAKKEGEGAYKLCLKVTMKTKDGKEYLLAHRVQDNKPIYASRGSFGGGFVRPTIGGVYHLPERLEDITHVHVQVSRID